MLKLHLHFVLYNILFNFKRYNNYILSNHFSLQKPRTKNTMTTKKARRVRIKYGIRNKISGTKDRPRVSVFKSNKAIYVQFINDEDGHTLLSGSSKFINEKKNVNTKDAKQLGENLGVQAIEKGVKTIIFDRNGYIYHGKVKAIAEGLREKGLLF